VKNRVVGERVARIGIRDKVTGHARYAADLEIKNALVLKVLRSSVAHGRIEKVAVEKAAAMKGVAGVFTAADIPGENLYGIINRDQTVLASEKVRFIGDPVVLVAAETEEIAEAALEAIEVEITPLPALFDPEAAMEPDAPAIHEAGNILFTRKIIRGDIEEGFAASDLIVEETYKTRMLEHAYLEPEAGIAYKDEPG